MREYILYAIAIVMAISVAAFYKKLDQIDTNLRSVEIQSIVSSGKAIYMPGNVCILRSTSDISPEKMREFADACIQSHKEWLEISDEEPIYSDEDTEGPF